jgi:hypothetical protein
MGLPIRFGRCQTFWVFFCEVFVDVFDVGADRRLTWRAFVETVAPQLKRTHMHLRKTRGPSIPNFNGLFRGGCFIFAHFMVGFHGQANLEIVREVLELSLHIADITPIKIHDSQTRGDFAQIFMGMRLYVILKPFNAREVLAGIKEEIHTRFRVRK